MSKLIFRKAHLPMLTTEVQEGGLARDEDWIPVVLVNDRPYLDWELIVATFGSEDAAFDAIQRAYEKPKASPGSLFAGKTGEI